MTEPEQQAEEIIKYFNINIPISPSDVCQKLSSENYNICYEEKDGFVSPDILGMSAGTDSQAKILVNANIRPITRKLFTAAHEIGHVILHIQTGKKSKSECDAEDIQRKGDSNANFETEANQFASALLMPKFLIQDDIRKNDLS